MKYTRENLDNQTVFMLREKARHDQRTAKALVEHIDDWLLRRDENALQFVLAKLNEHEPK